jgi:hypothetical protein
LKVGEEFLELVGDAVLLGAMNLGVIPVAKDVLSHFW